MLMEHYEPATLNNVLWFLGWCLALLVLFVLGIRLPLQTRWRRSGNLVYVTVTVVAASALVVLANVALVVHDVHFDLTRARVFTPSTPKRGSTSPRRLPSTSSFWPPRPGWSRPIAAQPRPRDSTTTPRWTRCSRRFDADVVDRRSSIDWGRWTMDDGRWTILIA